MKDCFSVLQDLIVYHLHTLDHDIARKIILYTSWSAHVSRDILRIWHICNFPSMYKIFNLNQSYQVSQQNNEICDYDKFSKFPLLNSLDCRRTRSKLCIL